MSSTDGIQLKSRRGNWGLASLIDGRQCSERGSSGGSRVRMTTARDFIGGQNRWWNLSQAHQQLCRVRGGTGKLEDVRGR